MVSIIINNIFYNVDKNLTVLQACEQAKILIPRFCYYEKLSIAGNCRMCLVEIEKSPKPVAACAMPINQGMVIFTETPLVKKARESILEFLLINHPLDCPICDQGGECDLQDLTISYGSDRSRFFEFKRKIEDKECGPIIKTIMTRCIHCTRCIRFLTELAGIEVFGALGRGEFMEIGTYLNKYLKTELSGNLIDLCPVGALTSRPYAFLARAWELRKIESIDYTDSIGSNIIIHTRISSQRSQKVKVKLNEQILRILPKFNNEINCNWISDKIRYSFDGIYLNRNLNINIAYPQKCFENLWTVKHSEKFLEKYFLKKRGYNTLGAIGAVSSVEDLYFFWNFLNLISYNQGSLLLNNSLYSINKDLPEFFQFNSKFKAIEISDLIFFIGINPRFESSMLNLRIRKHFFNKELFIGYLGPFMDITYPAIQLGNSSIIFLKIIEGLHKFCKNLRNSNKPLIILGSLIGLRNDGKSLQNIYQFLGQKSFLNLKNFIGVNILHTNVTQIQLCDIGISILSRNFLNKIALKKDYLKKSKTLCFLNNIDKFIAPTTVLKWFCVLNSFQMVNYKEIFFNIPFKLCVEKTSQFINSEGRLQIAFKAISVQNNILNDNFFWKIYWKLNVNVNSAIYLQLNPSLKTNIVRKHFQLNFLLKYNLQEKIFRNIFTATFLNFFNTDIISMQSKNMAECSIFLKNRTPNFNLN